VAGLSEHDRDVLYGIERELTTSDPGLARELLRFERRSALRRLRALSRTWLVFDALGFLLGVGLALLLAFAR
jgi:hypothetical protein